MIASPLLSSSSASSSSSSQLLRDKVFRRSSSLPPLRPAPSPHVLRISASCAAAAERERERTTDYHTYSRSRSYGGGGMAAAAGAGATLYDVLGLTAGATAVDIKAAYRRLARACHPDVAAAGGKGASADEFMRVHAAYATLSDPGKRADYDRQVLAAGATRRRGPSGFSWTTAAAASHYSPPSPASPNPSSPSSSFGRRTWETDQCW